MESVSDFDTHAFIDANESGHKQIKGGIEFGSSIPRNNMGKILRRELRVQYANNSGK
jgi:acyl-coenzyme A synthetase/AMP-(fatty) acid ligase